MMMRIILFVLSTFPALALAQDDVFLQVLGIAQDAGYPQTNCYQPHCMRAWEDESARRMASSIAVVDTVDQTKYLFDATPDMREQLFALHQTAPDPTYALNGVFLTHAHMGHYTGLMHFGREGVGAKGIPVYAMPVMTEYLQRNGPWELLVRLQNIHLMPLASSRAVKFSDRLSVTPIEVPHRPEYSETVGYRIDGPNRSAVFIPDIDKWAVWKTDIRDIIRSVDYALLDATFYADGELPGRDMSKIKHPFVSESMDLFEGLTAEEKSRVIFIHMNHTNPLLVEGSAEREEVKNRGFKIATEGMRLAL